MPDKTFGEVIKEERELLCLTLEEVAKEIGVSVTTIYAWEHNKKKPHKRHIRAIAEFYCVSTKKLVQLLNK